jgi:hypothetical protein
MLAGGAAGAMQAIAAAPVENVRLIIEGGRSKVGWSHAWKEVFLRSEHATSTASAPAKARKAREVRDWTRELRQMAGRGWEGWGWGVAKDTCGEFLRIVFHLVLTSKKDLLFSSLRSI